MLIIIEGPDGSGKTTLVKKLCDEYGYTELKCLQRELPNQYDEWCALFKKYCYGGKFIMDRCYISEWIYRIVKNDKICNISLLDITLLLTLYSNDVMYIFCNNENAFNNAKRRGESYIKTVSEHSEICSLYKFIYRTLQKFTNVNVYEYDYSKQSILNLLKQLEK